MQWKFERLAKDSKWVTKALSGLDKAFEHKGDTPGKDESHKLADDLKACQFYSERSPQPPDAPVWNDGVLAKEWKHWEQQVKHRDSALRKQRKEIRDAERKRQIGLARRKMQTLFATKQKQANKIISGASSNSQILALRNDLGEVVSDPKAVTDTVNAYFRDLAKPINGEKNGKYMPADT